MPDLDKIERNLPPGWRAPYRLLKGKQPPFETGQAIVTALADSLRKHGGAPGLETVASAVQALDTSTLDDRKFANIVRQVEQRNMPSRHGRIVARAGLKALSHDSSAPLRGPADERVADDFIMTLIDHNLFSRALPYLAGKEHFPDYASALEYKRKVLQIIQPSLKKMTKSLAKNPSARKFRAPRLRSDNKQTTRELLNIPL